MKDRTYKAIILISLCLCILHTAYERFFVADWHDREWNEGAWRGRVDWWGFFWGLIMWIIVVPGIITIAQNKNQK